MFLPITLTIAAAAALLNLWLAMRVSRVRGSAKIPIGDGGNDQLIRRMRAHANFAENIPIALILIGAIELARGQSPMLWAAGIAFIIARICHAFGMDSDRLVRGRMIGVAMTIAILLGLAIYALYLVYTGPFPMRAPDMIGEPV